MTGTPSASGSHDPHSPKRADPDADIILRLSQGQSAALGELMDRHLAAIKSTARYILGDEMMAEDIAQETFLRAWKQAPNWQSGKARFSTWMHRVAKNLCYDRLRKKKEIYSDNLPEMVDAGLNANDRLEANQVNDHRKTHLESALAQLPERQRLAIALCHYREMSQIDAADIMEIGVRAYESLLARARKNLKGQLLSHKTELLEG